MQTVSLYLCYIQFCTEDAECNLRGVKVILFLFVIVIVVCKVVIPLREKRHSYRLQSYEDSSSHMLSASDRRNSITNTHNSYPD